MGWILFFVALGALAWQNREKLGFGPTTKTADDHVDFEDEPPKRVLDFSTGHAVEDPEDTTICLILKAGQAPGTKRGDGHEIIDWLPVHLGNTDAKPGNDTLALSLDQHCWLIIGPIQEQLQGRMQSTSGSTPPDLLASLAGLFVTEAYLYLQAAGQGHWGKGFRTEEGALRWERFTGMFLVHLNAQGPGKMHAWQLSTEPVAPEMAELWKQLLGHVTDMERHGVVKHWLGAILHNVIGQMDQSLGMQAGIQGLVGGARELGAGPRTRAATPRMAAQLAPETGVRGPDPDVVAERRIGLGRRTRGTDPGGPVDLSDLQPPGDGAA